MKFAEAEARLEEFIEKNEIIENNGIMSTSEIWKIFYGLKKEYEDNEQ